MPCCPKAPKAIQWCCPLGREPKRGSFQCSQVRPVQICVCVGSIGWGFHPWLTACLTRQKPNSMLSLWPFVVCNLRLLDVFGAIYFKVSKNSNFWQYGLTLCSQIPSPYDITHCPARHYPHQALQTHRKWRLSSCTNNLWVCAVWLKEKDNKRENTVHLFCIQPYQNTCTNQTTLEWGFSDLLFLAARQETVCSKLATNNPFHMVEKRNATSSRPWWEAAALPIGEGDWTAGIVLCLQLCWEAGLWARHFSA